MSLHSKYHSVPDERWLEILTNPPENGLIGQFKRWLGTGGALPTFPDEQLQKKFVGSSWDAALREGFLFYKTIKQHCVSFAHPISSECRILDYGCGWGRITRFFLKDVLQENLAGADVDPNIIQVCKSTLREGQYEVVDAYPPSDFADQFFDVVYAYSVFSHLAKEAHLRWIDEFVRILRPGGLLFITTQKRSFIEYCNNLQPQEITTTWHQSLAKAFRPLDETLAQYDRGELVYSPTGGGGVLNASFYGEAAFSGSFAEHYWPAELEVLIFDDTSLPQALIIARKRSP